MLQVGSPNYEIQTFTAIILQLVECGKKMYIMIFAGEMAHFRHSFTLGK